MKRLSLKVGVALTLQDCINTKFQVSVQINNFYCTIKSKQTSFKLKIKNLKRK